MKISYNWLKEYVKPLPKPEKLADLLTMHSFEVEEVREVRLPSGKSDFVLHIDILPNRAHDCLSHVGVARECSAIANLKFKIKNLKLVESKESNVKDFIDVKIENSEACPRYTARVITNIKVGPSPKWLKQRLKTIDQKPINNIVDATNYVMFEMGQPVHAFDLDKISSVKSQIPKSKSQTNLKNQISNPKTIFIRMAKKGERITTLDNETCKLDKDILVIADAKTPLALAGVKGGKKAEITNKTKTIVLESANFNYQTVRATSRKTGIRTESSLRFEHELDANLTREAIDRVVGLIQQIGDGQVAKNIIDVYPHHQKFGVGVKIKLNLDKIESILGIKVSKQEVIKYLKSLTFEIDNSLKVTVPSFRQDIKIEEDLIEEVVRLIGYNNIPVKAPLGLLGITKLDDILSLTNKIKTIFEGLGFTEVYNFSFVGEGGPEYLEMENPLSLDLKYLRRDLLTNLLKNVKNNIKSFQEIKIFELGKVYKPAKEEKMLAGLIAGRIEKIKGEKFYELKGVVDSLFNKLGITDHWYDPIEDLPVAAEVKVGDEEIGWIKEVDSNVVGFNLNFEKILKLAQEELIYQTPSLYPAAVRDLAVLVNQGDRVVDVLNLINRIGGDLVRDVDLFDMYEGEEIPRNKKNLAFHIIYQSDERTLKDEEVDKIQKRIIRELEKKRGWQVRK